MLPVWLDSCHKLNYNGSVDVKYVSRAKKRQKTKSGWQGRINRNCVSETPLVRLFGLIVYFA